ILGAILPLVSGLLSNKL
uniref:Alyteserin-2b n=1 Tax=Alytes obstetricans TaxID=8443 RepID=ATI2B_ALYOB|nr:RecName: Full=Alyteserin-2b [Alytes obstetricans]